MTIIYIAAVIVGAALGLWIYIIRQVRKFQQQIDDTRGDS